MRWAPSSWQTCPSTCPGMRRCWWQVCPSDRGYRPHSAAPPPRCRQTRGYDTPPSPAWRSPGEPTAPHTAYNTAVTHYNNNNRCIWHGLSKKPYWHISRASSWLSLYNVDQRFSGNRGFLPGWKLPVTLYDLLLSVEFRAGPLLLPIWPQRHTTTQSDSR